MKKISKNAQRLLLWAAEYLKDDNHWYRGWCDGDSYSTSHKVCALGAIRKGAVELGMEKRDGAVDYYRTSVGGNADIIDAEAALESVVMSDIPSWNDRRSTTHQDVHAAYCLAVKQYVDPNIVTDEEVK